MADYKSLYYKMFNTVTDAEVLVSQVARIMRAAQIECEEIFIEADDTPIALVENPEE